MVWHWEKPWEKKYSVLDAFYNLIAACSQPELNSGRHFLSKVTKMHLDMQQITCSSGLFSAKHNKKNLLKCYCLLINTLRIIAASSN